MRQERAARWGRLVRRNGRDIRTEKLSAKVACNKMGGYVCLYDYIFYVIELKDLGRSLATSSTCEYQFQKHHRTAAKIRLLQQRGYR